MNNKSWLTAIRRRKLSLPMAELAERGLLVGKVLDFGCGRGDDARHLNEEKSWWDTVCSVNPAYQYKRPARVTVDGLTGRVDAYDVHHAKDGIKRVQYDTITCHYVLNVVDEHERHSILNQIRMLLKPGAIAYIAVRRDIKADYVTGKGTQQYFVTLPAEVLVERRGSFIMYQVRG